MLEKSLGLMVFLKKPQDYVEGLVPIYFRITVDGVPKEMSTKRFCDPEKWNAKANRAIGKKEDVRNLNAYLDVKNYLFRISLFDDNLKYVLNLFLFCLGKMGDGSFHQIDINSKIQKSSCSNEGT